jgi:hypothetical protein
VEGVWGRGETNVGKGVDRSKDDTMKQVKIQGERSEKGKVRELVARGNR